MTKEEAIAIWTQLEKQQYHLDPSDEDLEAGHKGWDKMVFDVRLDATTGNEGERDYRVRVTAAWETADDLGPEWWRDVCTAAFDAGVDLLIQNNGIELS